MPLFFLLSGYLHTVKPDLRTYAKKKAVHLLVPYVSFLVLLYPVELLRIALHPRPGHPLEHALLAAAWGGNRLRSLPGVFWFLPCLFVTQQVMNFLLLRLRLIAVCCLTFGGYLLTEFSVHLWPTFTLPLDLNVVPAAMPFFLVGFLAARHPYSTPRWAGFAVAGAAASVYLIHRSLPVSYDMREGVYGITGLSLLLAVCCAGTVILVTRLSAWVPPVQKALASLGAASLGIMFLHKQLPAVPYLHRWADKHGYLASLVYLLVAWLLTRLLDRMAITRALLLGSEPDFRALTGQWSRWRGPAATSLEKATKCRPA